MQHLSADLPLWVQGRAGAGKTSLLHAVAAARRAQGGRVAWVDLADEAGGESLLTRLVAALGPPETVTLLERCLRQADARLDLSRALAAAFPTLGAKDIDAATAELRRVLAAATADGRRVRLA